MKSVKYISISALSVILIASAILLTNCRKVTNDSRQGCVEEMVQVDESKLLIEHFEKHGDPVNCQKACFMTAEEVNDKLDKNTYVLDLRMKKDYDKAHIDGAIHMPVEGLHFHFFEAIKPFKYDQIILCCYSGQSASYTTSILRMLGFDNVYALKWGMASWNDMFAKKWNSKVKQNLNIKQDQEEVNLTELSEFPVLETKTIYREEIAKIRGRSLLNIGFKSARIESNKLFKRKDNQIVIAYCSKEEYEKSHITGAIHFPIKESLKRNALLNYLPADKEIIIYSPHGFESAYATAYLRMLGYNAKTVLYGMNSFNEHVDGSFGPSEIHSYPVIKAEENQSHAAPAEEEGGC